MADVIRKRETEAGPCSSCGRDLSQWETGFPIDLVLEAVLLDPALLEPLLVRRCQGCGAEYDWDIVITPDDDPEREWPETAALQAELCEAMREMLRTPLLQPGDAARLIRRRFAVEGIYVEDGSEVASPLRRLRDRSAR